MSSNQARRMRIRPNSSEIPTLVDYGHFMFRTCGDEPITCSGYSLQFKGDNSRTNDTNTLQKKMQRTKFLGQNSSKN